jgi:hypothetical protein
LDRERVERRRGTGGRRAGAVACSAAGLALLIGCAPRQVVPLSLTPADLTVFVDSRPIEGAPPDSLALRADRPHVLFFRKVGYRPEQVVLRSERVGGEPKLRPARIDVRLERLAPVGRRLEVELEVEVELEDELEEALEAELEAQLNDELDADPVEASEPSGSTEPQGDAGASPPH